MTQGQDLPPGAKFADFTIEGVLGRGGMGVVYRARQERLSRLVALKVIAPHLTHDVGFRERFRREAAMAAAIDHPSILPIYEAGEFEEQPFIVMRHVDGTDLKTLIERKGRLEPQRAVEITSTSPAPSTPRTGAASSTATSSPRTSSWRRGRREHRLPDRLRPRHAAATPSA